MQITKKTKKNEYDMTTHWLHLKDISIKNYDWKKNLTVNSADLEVKTLHRVACEHKLRLENEYGLKDTFGMPWTPV